MKKQWGIGGAVVVIGVGIAAYFWNRSRIRTDTDRVSYAIGVRIGENLKHEALPLNPQIVARAIKDVLMGAEPALSPEQLQAALHVLQSQTEQVHVATAQDSLRQAQAFLEENASKPEVKTLASGLQVQMIKEGKGKAPKTDSKVVVKYSGRLITGEEFDSSEKVGKSVELKVAQTLPGLKEGLLTMREGAVSRFFLPPSLAYGPDARPGIPSNAVLIFDVVLIKVP